MNQHVASLEKNPTNGKKPYIAPAYKRLTPEDAKKLLLGADVNDPDVMNMLRCIEDLQKRNESGTPD